MVLPRRRPCLPRTGLVRRPSGPACVRPHAGRPQQEVRPSPHERDEQQHGRLEHCLVAPGSFAPRPAQCAMRAGDRCRAPGRSPRSGRNTCCSRSDGRSREQDEPMGDQDDARTMKTMKIPSYTGYSHQQGFQEKNQQGLKKNQQTENTEGQRRIFRSSSGLAGKMTESPSCHPLPPTAKTTKIPSPSHRLGCGPESEGDRRFFGVTTAKTMKIPSPRPPPGQ